MKERENRVSVCVGYRAFTTSSCWVAVEKEKKYRGKNRRRRISDLLSE